LKAIYEIDIRSENVVLKFPPLPLVPQGAKWDGIQVQPVAVFQESKTGTQQNPVTTKDITSAKTIDFVLSGQKIGKHTLELTLHPTVQIVDATKRKISIDKIPSVPNATLELSLSPDVSLISVENALGLTTNEPGKMTTNLGSLDNLTLSWTDNTMRGAQTVIDLDQLFWLHIRTNQVEVVAQYKFRVNNGKVEHLLLPTDERMQLIGSPFCETHSDETFEIDTSTEGVVRLIPKEPLSGQHTIRANFSLRNFSGIGVLPLLHIAAQPNQLLSRSWLGISYDSPLHLDRLPLSKISTDRFRQLWETPVTTTLVAAYDLTNLESDASVSIKAQDSSLKADEITSVLLRADRTEMKYDAVIQSTNQIFDNTLLIPEDFDIEQLTVTSKATGSEKNDTVPVRWVVRPQLVSLNNTQKAASTAPTVSGISNTANSADNEPEPLYKKVSIFFDNPIMQQYQISILGKITSKESLALDATRQIPLIFVENADVTINRLQIFRSQNILVQNKIIPSIWTEETQNGFTKVETNNLEATRVWDNAIPVGVWNIKKNVSDESKIDPPLTQNIIPAFTLSLNDPKVSGFQVTQLVRNQFNDRWELATEFCLDIENGEIGELRLLYSEPSVFPPKVIPPMKASEATENGKRILVLTPRQPLSGNVRFLLISSLASTTEMVSISGITFLDLPLVKHYIVLPHELQKKSVEWEKERLTALPEDESLKILDYLSGTDTNRPEEFTTTIGAILPKNVSVFLANSPDFRVSLSSNGNKPIVPLNDVNLYIRKNGEILGISTFDLKSEGTEHCVLTIPAEYELLHIIINGVSSRGTQISPGKYQISLWPNQFPQRIETIFKGKSSSLTNSAKETSAVNIPLPRLEPAEVVGTIWTIAFEGEQNTSLQYYVKQNFVPAVSPKITQNAQSDSILNRHEESAPQDNKSETFSAQELAEYARLSQVPLSASTAIPTQLRFDIIRLSTLESLMSFAVSALPNTGPAAQNSFSTSEIGLTPSNPYSTSNSVTADLAIWYSLWGRQWWGTKRNLDSLVNLRDNSDKKLKNTYYFRSDIAIPASMATILDINQTADHLLKSLADSHQESVKKTGLDVLAKEFADANFLFENESTAFRLSIAENPSYLFGVSNGEITSLQLITLPGRQSFFASPAIKFALTALAVIVAGVLVRNIHPRRLFRQYPFFVGTVCAISLWIFLPPGYIGLLLLPLIWLAMVWPSWRIRREK
ncbi:MAG: hypothetical protein ACRC2T_12960, partial [Thermoguttaceae bacterium]